MDWEVAVFLLELEADDPLAFENQNWAML